MRTYPNLLWIAINLIFLSLIATILVSMILAINSNGNYAILIPCAVVALALLMLYFQLSDQFAFLTVDDNGIKIYQPLKFKNTKLKWEEINGYSISQFKYGRNLYASKSFVIYSKEAKPIEIIKLFNYKFEELLSSLKNYKITKLGHEPYQTGFYKRKYMFTK